MTLEWTTTYIVEFPNEDIERICNYARKHGYSYDKIYNMVRDTTMGFEDDDYYAWGEEQTHEVMKEIQSRIGGVQLSMFNDPFGVPEDYNEGWQ